MIDSNERVVMRASAHADACVAELKREGSLVVAVTGPCELVSIADFKAMVRSAFFIGYGAGALDASSPRATPLGGAGERRKR